MVGRGSATKRRLAGSILVIGMIGACSSPSAPTSVAPGSSPAPASGAATTACTVPPGQSEAVTWTIDGMERAARVHAPATATDRPPPIVIALHGYGGFGLELEQISDLSDASDAHGWLVVYPEGTGSPQEWQYDPAAPAGHARDIAFLRQLIADITKEGCGDAKRIVVTGISQGGWLSDMVGCEMTDLVAAVVPVAARDFGWACAPSRAIPFTAISGVLDEVLPYEGGPVNAPPPFTSVGSVDDWTADRAASRGCAGASTDSTASAHVSVRTWPGCDAPVTAYRVEDGGHSWPSGGGMQPVDRELSVTKVIADLIAAIPD